MTATPMAAWASGLAAARPAPWHALRAGTLLAARRVKLRLCMRPKREGAQLGLPPRCARVVCKRARESMQRAAKPAPGRPRCAECAAPAASAYRPGPEPPAPLKIKARGALRQNTGLRELDLGHAGVGAPGALALADALRDNAALRALRLAGARLGRAGGRALLAALPYAAGLALLALEGATFAPPGARPCASVCAPHMPRLEHSADSTSMCIALI